MRIERKRGGGHGRRKLKRALAIVVVAGLAVTIAGCSQNSDAGGVKTDGVKTLTLWTNLTVDAQAKVIQSQAEQCAKGLGVKLTFESVPFADMYTKLQNSFGSGTGPDIMNTTVSGVAFAQDKGYLVPLDGLIDGIGRSDFVPATLSEVSKDGHVWALPDFALHSEVWYRADLFKAAGITQLPKSWDQLLEVAKKVQENSGGSVSGLAVPLGRVQMAAQTLYQFLYSEGVMTFDKNGKFALGKDPQKVVKAIDFVKAAFKEVSPPAALNWLWPDFRGSFVNGNAAMVIDAGAVVGMAATDNPKILKDIKAFPLPGPTAGTPQVANLGGGYGFMVGKSTTAREKVATKLVQCMSSVKKTAARVDSRPVFAIPTRLSVQKAPEYTSNPTVKQFADEIAMIQRDVLPHSLYYGLEAGLNPVVSTIEGTSLFGEQLQGVVTDQIAPEAAAKTIIEKMREASK